MRNVKTIVVFLLVALLTLCCIPTAMAEDAAIYTTAELMKDTCGTGVSIVNTDKGVKITGSGSNAQRCDYCNPIDLDGMRVIYRDVQIKTGASLAFTFGGSEMGAWYDSTLCMFFVKNTGSGTASIILKQYKGLAGRVVQSDSISVDCFGEGKTLDLQLKKKSEDEWTISVNGKGVEFDAKELSFLGTRTSSAYYAMGVFDQGGSWTMKLESIMAANFTREIEKVVAAIKAIGKVTADDDCGILISEARAAYNAMPRHLRGGVTNLSVLEDAEELYEKLCSAPTTAKTTKKPTQKPAEDGVIYFHNTAENVHLSAKAKADTLEVTSPGNGSDLFTYPDGAEEIKCYAIALKKGGTEVKPEGEMLLRLPVTGDGSFGIFALRDGKAVEIASTRVGNYLCAVIKETGTYAVGSVTRENADNPYTGESFLLLAVACGAMLAASIAAIVLRKKARA